jgi:chromosome segregation ATPase
MSESVEKTNVSNDVSSEDIEKVKKLRSKYATATAQIGQVEIELHVMNKRLEDLSVLREQLLNSYTELQKEEDQLVKELNDKYGDGILDLEENKFVPSKLD